jgi:translation initiation factor 4G
MESQKITSKKDPLITEVKFIMNKLTPDNSKKLIKELEK